MCSTSTSTPSISGVDLRGLVVPGRRDGADDERTADHARQPRPERDRGVGVGPGQVPDEHGHDDSPSVGPVGPVGPDAPIASAGAMSREWRAP